MAKKQLEIAGTERPKHAEIEAAADGYVQERNKRMKLTVKEKAAKVGLIAAMRKHDILVYRDDEHVPPLLVTLSSKDDVRVEEASDDREEVALDD